MNASQSPIPIRIIHNSEVNDSRGLCESILRDGVCIIKQVIDDPFAKRLCEAVEAAATDESVRKRKGSTFAIRNLTQKVPLMRELANSPVVRRLAETIIGDAFLVRSILFDKTPDANWHVGWHQDVAIAVKDRIDVPGFGPWSVKAGVQHVRPPAHVLDRMLTVPLHLDACDETGGALCVIPGRHRAGFLQPESILSDVKAGHSRTCCVNRGDAIIMRPLLPHASSPAEKPARRRVVHLEFAGGTLPGGLDWWREM